MFIKAAAAVVRDVELSELPITGGRKPRKTQKQNTLHTTGVDGVDAVDGSFLVMETCWNHKVTDPVTKDQQSRGVLWHQFYQATSHSESLAP